MSAVWDDREHPRPRTHGPFRRHRRGDPCPVCGHESWCRTFADGDTHCMRVESDRACRSGGWLHRTGPGDPPDGGWRERLWASRPVAPAAPTKAEPDVLHAVYARLIELLPLSPAHRAQLRARGFADAQIAARGYASLPRTGRAAVARRLIEEFGRHLLGSVPGLYLRRDNAGRPYPTLAGGAGLLIPVRDAERRIVGLQIRLDEAGEGGKYAWLSSREDRNGRPREGGCGSGAPPHVAPPLEPGTAVTRLPADLVVTEGPLKADLAADRLGAVVVAVPGVGTHAGVPGIARQLRARRVAAAYDMDRLTKPQVASAADALAAALAAAGVTPLLAAWDPAHKGLDDALVAGAEIVVGPYPLKRRAGRLEPIPPELVPTPPPRPIKSVAESHAEHRRFYRDLLLADRITSRQAQAWAVTTPTGGGKTDSLAREIALIQREGSWPQAADRTRRGTHPLRVLYVAPTTEAATAFRDMALAAGGDCLLVEGRHPDPAHAWGCHRPETIHLVGERRHNPAADVCRACKAEYEAVHGHGWSCNYLTSKRVAEERTVVAAPVDAFFNGSRELRKFDLVAVDEAILPALTELVALTRAHLHDWLRRMSELAAERPTSPGRGGAPETTARYGLDDPFYRLAAALLNLVDRAGAVGREWRPALPVLREVCPDLPNLIATLVDLKPNDRSQRYAFETPARLRAPDELVPLRLARDLILALAAEFARPEGSDTRLWLTPDGLQLFTVREHLLAILREKTLVNLDATPSPLLRRLFPELREFRVDVAAPTHVTQVTDFLATRTQLAGEANPRRERVLAALEAVTQDAAAPVVFTFKALDPNAGGDGPTLAVGNPAAQYGHFDKETRSLNRFADTDVLCLVGHYSAPLSLLRAQVQGLRFAAVPPAAGPGSPGLRLLPYQWRAADGTGLGRWTKADPDPDVDELIRWSEASTVVQAVGRGRAVLRADVAPLRVYLLGSMPIAGLPVDRLVTLAELGAPGPERRTPSGFYAARDARNRATEDANRERVVAAIAEVEAEGIPVTFAEVGRRARVSRVTLCNNLTLHALVSQAKHGGNGSVTGGVNPWTDNDKDIRPRVYPPSNGPAPPSADLRPAREAIAVADRAAGAAAFRRANATLAVRLEAIARARGRDPIPKVGPPRRDIPPPAPRGEEDVPWA